jgi:hypothetical protein
MGWNYRVIAKTYKDKTFFGIHEVFYNEDGIPDTCTIDAISVGGDTLRGISETLNLMRLALVKPILNFSDFEKGGKYFTDVRDSLPHPERYE